jgi:hypothetical protein
MPIEATVPNAAAASNKLRIIDLPEESPWTKAGDFAEASVSNRSGDANLPGASPRGLISSKEKPPAVACQGFFRVSSDHVDQNTRCARTLKVTVFWSLNS